MIGIEVVKHKTSFRVGRTLIDKVHELDLDGFALTQLLPALNPHVTARHPNWIPPSTQDSEGHALLSVHSWLVRHEGLVILIDTGAGNGKSRPGLAVLDGLHGPYLDRLAAAGVRPEAVDYVLLTHLHADHVGWNTRRDGDTWVPTFPNAQIVCSGREWCYGVALTEGDEPEIRRIRAEAGLGVPVRIPASGVFEDSLRPLATAGRLRLIAVDGAEVLPGVRFVSTPGHSIDHAAIEIVSDGELAIFGGDVMHHPVEVYDPDLVSMFCEFPDAVRRSRRIVLERASETGALYVSSHFPHSSAGRIECRPDGGHAWTFCDPNV